MSFLSLGLSRALFLLVAVFVHLLGPSTRNSYHSHIQSTERHGSVPFMPFHMLFTQPWEPFSSPSCCYIMSLLFNLPLHLHLSSDIFSSWELNWSPLLTPSSGRCVCLRYLALLIIFLYLLTVGKVLACKLLKGNADHLLSLLPQCVSQHLLQGLLVVGGEWMHQQVNRCTSKSAKHLGAMLELSWQHPELFLVTNALLWAHQDQTGTWWQEKRNEQESETASRNFTCQRKQCLQTASKK